MEKEFIPYEQALALKELGFDEPSLGWYTSDGSLIKEYITNKVNKFTLAPTFSQVFRWFRDKYGLYYYIAPEFYINGINFNWQVLWYLPKEEWTDHNISDGTFMYGDNGEYPTQESAEQACLDKLIEIVKNTQS
jgi:hypothetical protein